MAKQATAKVLVTTYPDKQRGRCAMPLVASPVAGPRPTAARKQQQQKPAAPQEPTAEEIAETVRRRQQARSAGQIGGHQRAILHTPAELSAQARSGTTVRWMRWILDRRPDLDWGSPDLPTMAEAAMREHMRILAEKSRLARMRKAHMEQAAHEAVMLVERAQRHAMLDNALRRLVDALIRDGNPRAVEQPDTHQCDWCAGESVQVRDRRKLHTVCPLHEFLFIAQTVADQERKDQQHRLAS